MKKMTTLFQKLLILFHKKGNKVYHDKELEKAANHSEGYEEHNVEEVLVNQKESPKDCKKTLKELESDFFNQFLVCNNPNLVSFIYRDSFNEDIQIVRTVETYSFHKSIINPIFANDKEKFVLVLFDREQYDYICFMDLVLSSKKFETINSFFGVSAFRIISRLKRVSPINENILEVDRAIEKIKSTELFENDEELYSFIRNRYYPFFEVLQEKKRLLIDRGPILNINKYKKLYKTVVEALKEKGEYTVKWKNEFNLFLLVKEFFPSAIFQFRDIWLDRQSLDIFIPELKLGIEYQGEQHYKSVSFFGDEEDYKKRKENDEIKRNKCRQEGVSLVEWPYNQSVNAENLEYELMKYNYILPEPKQKNNKPIPAIATMINENLHNYSLSNSYENDIQRAFRDENLYMLAQIMIELLVHDKVDDTKSLFIRVISTISRTESEALLKYACENATEEHDLLYIVASDDTIASYYLDGFRINYYTRRIIIKMLMIGIDDEKVVQYIKRIKMNYKKDDLSYIWIICDEVEETIISPERIKLLLRKAGISKPRKIKN